MDKSVGDLKKFFHEKKLIHHTTTENKKSRSGYIEISKIFKNYGFVTQDFIETYSSGEESDIEDDKIHEPSVREVNEKILDFRTIINVVSYFRLYTLNIFCLRKCLEFLLKSHFNFLQKYKKNRRFIKIFKYLIFHFNF